MIDNVILLITGTLHERDISELIPKVCVYSALLWRTLSSVLFALSRRRDTVFILCPGCRTLETALACAYAAHSFKTLILPPILTGNPSRQNTPQCHPLGMFEEIGSLSIATTPAELYNSVIIDTPLAPYFRDCITESDLDELNIEIIRNSLYKVGHRAPSYH